MADRGLRHILDNAPGGGRHNTVPAIEHALRSQVLQAQVEPRKASRQCGDAFASAALPTLLEAIERGASLRRPPQETHERLAAECELALAQCLARRRRTR